MMRCLLRCFRVANAEGGDRRRREVKGEGGGRSNGELVAPSLAPMENHEVGLRQADQRAALCSTFAVDAWLSDLGFDALFIRSVWGRGRDRCPGTRCPPCSSEKVPILLAAP
jgi:hypothetical protein